MKVIDRTLFTCACCRSGSCAAPARAEHRSLAVRLFRDCLVHQDRQGRLALRVRKDLWVCKERLVLLDRRDRWAIRVRLGPRGRRDQQAAATEAKWAHKGRLDPWAPLALRGHKAMPDPPDRKAQLDQPVRKEFLDHKARREHRAL